jgi:hypothetical protein
MSKIEKLVHVGCPFLFGMVLIICGLIMRSNPEKTLYVLMVICTGFVCLSICSVCAILVRILEK